MDPVIQIQKLSKQYALRESPAMYSSLRESITNLVAGPWRARKPKPLTGSSFWALKDIDLEIYQGDTVGIIGSNGAGKSTLLKILSRITDPTSGRIGVRGHLASLLEVGTGFHPELTGKENIYLNGAILGMRRAEIESKFDKIVSFAGVGDFLDTPVKRYSSGMYVRLAFSIAANLDPEILIVDEVLAVGDVAFQKKCLGKMAEACDRARTVLFVSHNLAALEALCKRAIVLQKGRLVFDGASKDAIDFYLRNVVGEVVESDSHVADLSAAPRAAHRTPQLKRLELYTGDGEPLRGGLPIGAPLRAVIAFDLETPCTSFDASLAFVTTSGQRVCTAHSAYEPVREHEERAGSQVFVCDIHSLPLIPNDYKIQVTLDIAGQEVDVVEEACNLTVLKSDFYGTGVIPTKGMMLLENRWTFA